jgi:hypothetical protein
VVVHALNLSFEAEAERSKVHGQPGLHSKILSLKTKRKENNFVPERRILL